MTERNWYEVCQEIDCELTNEDYILATSKSNAINIYMQLHDISKCDKIAVCFASKQHILEVE